MIANPLAIIQARFASTRLPGKMILPIAGRPLIWYAWRRSVEAFGEENVVIAIPFTDDNAPLIAICERFGARVFTWDGPEDDVLGRLWHCAYTYRWPPHSVICRVTPDDPWKGPELMRRVAAGERQWGRGGLEIDDACHGEAKHQRRHAQAQPGRRGEQRRRADRRRGIQDCRPVALHAAAGRLPEEQCRTRQRQPSPRCAGDTQAQGAHGDAEFGTAGRKARSDLHGCAGRPVRSHRRGPHDHRSPTNGSLSW